MNSFNKIKYSSGVLSISVFKRNVFKISTPSEIPVYTLVLPTSNNKIIYFIPLVIFYLVFSILCKMDSFFFHFEWLKHHHVLDRLLYSDVWNPLSLRHFF